MSETTTTTATAATAATAATPQDPAWSYEEYYIPAIFGPLTDVLLRHAPPASGERVLDVACGTGIVARRIAPIVGDDGHVQGVDRNPAMLEVARACAPPGPPIDWQLGDAAALEAADGSRDRVTCQQGLQFLPDRAAGVQEMRRVLGDGGIAVVAVWEGLDRHPFYASLFEAELPALARFGVPASEAELTAPFCFGDADALGALFTDAGFEQVHLVQGSIQARFVDPDRFVERLQLAYAAVIPEFVDDREAFAAYVDDVTRRTRSVVDAHREGDAVVVPMHTNLVVAS
jgi:ubiquinone/menaquinone biosynthesis C-methylase UbiE